ncbi:MAG: hypothetical protein ACTHM5_19700 [Ginsengibacter sp.]
MAESNSSIYSELIANGLITITKFADEVLLALNLQFKKDLSGAQVLSSIGRLEKKIKEEFPQVNQIYIEAANLSK